MAKIKLDLTNDKSESSSKFSTVPSGTYKVTLADSEFKNTTSGFGLTIGFMVEEGEHKGKLIRNFVNVKNASSQAEEIGRARLKRIMEVQGRKSFKLEEDTDLISSTEFFIVTELEDSTFLDKNDKEVTTKQNRIKKILPLEETTTEAPKKEAPQKEEAPKNEKKMPWDK